MNDAIAAVHAEDVEKARRFLRSAITQAGDAWVPSDAVLDALTFELIEMAGRSGDPARVATQLMQLGAQLKRPQTKTSLN